MTETSDQKPAPKMTPAQADIIAGEAKVKADPKNTAALYNMA